VPVPEQVNTYTFTVPEDVEEVILVVKGDVNKDGTLSNYDVTLAKAGSLGITEDFDEICRFAADMSVDGEFSNYDVTLLKAASLGRFTYGW
jgi:hypothetical protein